MAAMIDCSSNRRIIMVSSKGSVLLWLLIVLGIISIFQVFINYIMRDPETGNSRGFGFISYDSFETSDAAIEAMNGQYLCNRQITVSYAYKKDTKGERHGTPAERVLAASNPGGLQRNRPHTLFAVGPPTLPSGPQMNGTIAMPVPPRPYTNGSIPAGQMPPTRPPPPQGGPFPPPMHMPGPPSWPGQPQPGQVLMPRAIPPPPHQQFRAPDGSFPPNMPPPPAHLIRPPPPPAMWRQPPQQVMGGPIPPHQMSVPPPPPPNAPSHHSVNQNR